MRLDLGCGDKPREGFEGIDRRNGREVYPLEFADDSIEEIYASHVLEHFSHQQTLHVLREWNRVLVPGGTIRIAVPDFNKITEWFNNGPGNLPLEQYLMGGHVDSNDHHGAIFNEQKLRELMRLAGFGEIQPWKADKQDCAMLPVSLNLMGVKGAGPYPSLARDIVACFSMPRLAFTDNMFSGLRAFSALQISTIRKSGAFWGQCLQGSMELAMQRTFPPKYLLTLDYDTVFTPEDVLTLYRLMEANPHCGAICSLQCGRDRATPLMTVEGDNGRNRSIISHEEMESELLELRTGHFGLTLIRTDALQGLQKPWFMHKPDAEGRWGDGRIDDDIYFWLAFRQHGARLFQANRVVVGHAQLVISWPDQSLQTMHQYVAEYEASGKPEGVWQ